MEDVRGFLKNEALKCGISLDDEAVDGFMAYKDMLIEWNERINLTSITNDMGIIIKHFIDSLLCYSTGVIRPDARLMDIGTGAGFPGLALKIAFPSLKVCLMDSVQKKLNFLDNVIKALSLEDVELIWGRAEDYACKKGYRETFDVVTARAVASLPVLAEYCLPFAKVGGYVLCMKGPDVDGELMKADKAIKLMGGRLGDVLRAELPMSGGDRRIVVLNKVTRTPAAYPRRAGIPSKKPIM